jgi:hypothetical protein
MEHPPQLQRSVPLRWQSEMRLVHNVSRYIIDVFEFMTRNPFSDLIVACSQANLLMWSRRRQMEDTEKQRHAQAAEQALLARAQREQARIDRQIELASKAEAATRVRESYEVQCLLCVDLTASG